MREIEPDLALWKLVWAERRPRMRPNRLSGAQVREVLLARHRAQPFCDPRFDEVVLANLANYPYLSAQHPCVAAYRVENEAAGEGEFPCCLVGIELESGYVHCEGSDAIQDELFLAQGLNDKELENPFLVWRYVALQDGD